VKVLDTTVAIDHLRGESAATDLLGTLSARRERIVASEVVRFELHAGVREVEAAVVDAFCSTLTWSPVDARIARLGGELARQYRAAYSGIDDVDYLIAATTLVLDADLLTTNVPHFPMLEGLEPAY
jgi:predicted nucleic acid-binding protein